MRKRAWTAALITILGVSPFLGALSARAEPPMEERFQDLFVTAGYCTAFGAALGTAYLAFTSDPASNLRYVAMGASLGFIGGSILGSYVIFSPMIAADDRQVSPLERDTLLASQSIPEHAFALRPIFDAHTHALTSIEGGTTLLRF